MAKPKGPEQAANTQGIEEKKKKKKVFADAGLKKRCCWYVQYSSVICCRYLQASMFESFFCLIENFASFMTCDCTTKKSLGFFLSTQLVMQSTSKKHHHGKILM